MVHIDGDAGQYAVPVASSVDRFFEVYSRFLDGVSILHFPWAIPQLMAQVRAGRFDFLTNNEKAALEWLRKLQAAQT